MRKRGWSGLCLLLAGCAGGHTHDTLYQRLGGQAAIDQVVSGLLARADADPRISERFIGVDMVNLHDRLVEQICAETGGPCRYTGQSMPDAHAGLDIEPEEFEAMVEDLTAVLDQAGVAAVERDALLARLGAMQPEIVGQ